MDIIYRILFWSFVSVNGAILAGIAIGYLVGPILARRREEQTKPFYVSDETK